jgi:hypothetical protein
MTMQLPEYAGQDSAAPVKSIRTLFAGAGQQRTDEDHTRNTGRHGTVPSPRAADGLWPAPGSPAPGSPAPGSPGAGSPEPDGAAPNSQASVPARTRAGSGRARGRGQSRSARQRGAARDRDPRWPSLNLTNNVRLLSEDDLAHLPAADPPGVAAWAASGQLPRPGSSPPAQAAAADRSFEPTRGARPLDPTNNVRLLSPEDLTMRAADTPAGPSGGRAADAAPAGTPDPPAVPTARHAAAGAHTAAPGLADPISLPIAGYDQLTLPALRARLRWLDQGQIRVLIDYERANADRPEVVTMFERRIGKLRAERA